MSLKKITCNPKQSTQLVALGILPFSFIWHYYAPDLDPENKGNYTWLTIPLVGNGENGTPAWTKAELDAMIGPRFRKPDLWNEQRRDKSATDPHSYPVFVLQACFVFKNGAEASAHGLIYLLENNFLTASEANDRYQKTFLVDTY